MRIATTLADLRAWRLSLTSAQSLGFVPTMGALHAGHLRLMAESKENHAITAASIFVNPLQFGPKEDFSRYPRPFDEDVRKLADAGVDFLFAPAPQDFYHADHSTKVNVEGLDQYLCGASRPGHFSGVCTVVLKLFNLVRPHAAYFGQKDVQQALILKRMARDLSLDLAVRIVDTVRESSGLALSSRNVYLNEGEKRRAIALSRGLLSAFSLHVGGEKDADRLKDLVLREIMGSYPTRVDYIEAVDREGLRPLATLDKPSVLAAAVFYGKTRLIDNIFLD